MKKLILPCLLAHLFSVQPGRAMIVYSGIQDLPIPLNSEGAYLQIHSGATAAAFPLDWATAPWINPFFGGVYIGNSPLRRPVITGTDQVINLAPGVSIGGGSNFVSGESGSTTHVGAGAGQFALNVPGYLGFTFAPTVGGPDHYGWLQIEIHNTGPGKIISWAYEDTPGASIEAGAPVVPEPGSLALLALAGAGLTLRRRRG
jgi:PEP-CTERM motif